MKTLHSLVASLRPVSSILARRIAFPLLFLGAGLVVVQPCAGQSGTWSATGSLATARDSHTATLLPNGQVLVAGGRGLGPFHSTTILANAELYDPASGSWAPTGSLNTARFGETATLLPSGQVLVTGGSSGATILASAELYDSASGTWTPTGSLNTSRTIHTATLLPNGNVLVAGGFNVTASAELYDPASGTWAVTGSLVMARDSHTATLLPNGKVLVVGGYPAGASAELYDPATGTWTATGDLVTARDSHTATLLPNGQVLVAGGSTGSTVLASAELYNPASGSWSATGSLNSARNSHTATLLPSGKVLVAGGLNGTSLASAELYDPASGTWTTNGSLATGRFFHTATLLPSGKVLVAGGFNGTAVLDGTILASAELYDPQTPIPGGKALNISARVDVETGDNVAIGGFIISGGTTSKTIIIRAIGPSLANPTLPVAGLLADPVLELHKPDGSVVTNNDWKENTSADQAIVVANGLDQFNGRPINDLESVLVATLPATDPTVSGSGTYTAIVSGNDASTGIGLLEVYDLDGPAAIADLANFSTRGLVGTGNKPLIGGVIIAPIEGIPAPNATVVVRAIGPSLANAVPPVAESLADPLLELFDVNGDLIATNDNWQQNDPSTVVEIQADGLAPTNASESALLATLMPGAYTAIVSSNNGTTGVGLVEIYHVPTPTSRSAAH